MGHTQWPALSLAVLAVILLGVLVWQSISQKRQQRRLLGRLQRTLAEQERAIGRLDREFVRQNGRVRALAEQQANMREAIDQRMDALQSSNEQKLGEIRDTVGGKLDERLTASFSSVNRQLAEVHSGLGQMRELAGEFSDLRKVLGGVKTRGIWGEAQLRGLLEEMLAAGQYRENVAIPAGSQTRVEFAIRLPARGGECLLPIDSKFPREDFLRLAEASERGNPEETEAMTARLERALTDQAKLIREKYIRPPETTDFAIMFLPAESLYAEAARRRGLCEKLQERYRVLVAGPNTLCALLTSLRMGFQTVALEHRSTEVLRLFDELETEFGAYEEAVANTRRRFNQASQALDALEQQTRKLGRRMKQLKKDDAP